MSSPFVSLLVLLLSCASLATSCVFAMVIVLYCWYQYGASCFVHSPMLGVAGVMAYKHGPPSLPPPSLPPMESSQAMT